MILQRIMIIRNKKVANHATLKVFHQKAKLAIFFSFDKE